MLQLFNTQSIIIFYDQSTTLTFPYIININIQTYKSDYDHYINIYPKPDNTGKRNNLI